MQQENKKQLKVLKRHLRDFYNLLASKPKPSNEVIRDEFLRHEAEWRIYCTEHGLTAHLAELFNANVSVEWERRSKLRKP